MRGNNGHVSNTEKQEKGHVSLVLIQMCWQEQNVTKKKYWSPTSFHGPLWHYPKSQQRGPGNEVDWITRSFLLYFLNHKYSRFSPTWLFRMTTVATLVHRLNSTTHPLLPSIWCNFRLSCTSTLFPGVFHLPTPKGASFGVGGSKTLRMRLSPSDVLYHQILFPVRNAALV